MADSYFVTDIAIEAAQRAGFEDESRRKQLSFGIEQRYLNIKSEELSKKIGRERGIYITYDCVGSVYNSNRACEALEKYLANTVSELTGIIRRTSPVFVVGLGNGEIVADSLGSQTVSKIAVNRQNYEKGDSNSQLVCAISAGVYGATGIQSLEVVKSLVDTVKPSVVIVVDSFATSSVNRLGLSYQLSTAGIAPGSGVGQDKERINKSVLGVPVIAIGVPLLLSMKTLISGFVGDFLEDSGCEKNEYKLRSWLAERKLSQLIVAPKDIKFLVDITSGIIANAINKAFLKI